MPNYTHRDSGNNKVTQELALGPGSTGDRPASGHQGEGCVMIESLESRTKQRRVQSHAPTLTNHVAGHEQPVHFLICKSRMINIYLFWVLWQLSGKVAHAVPGTWSVINGCSSRRQKVGCHGQGELRAEFHLKDVSCAWKFSPTLSWGSWVIWECQSMMGKRHPMFCLIN